MARPVTIGAPSSSVDPRHPVVAGAGYKVEHMREAEGKGAQAYITGEIHARIIADDYGRRLLAETRAFAAQTSMALNGVSHAASEHLVMETQIAEWFTSRFQVQVLPIRPSRWWP